MKRINIDSSKEDIDTFLNINYGYGYWNFADSLFTVYLLYKSKDYETTRRLVDKRIERLEELKKKIVEIVDNFLIDIDFYRYSKNHKSLSGRSFKWTLNNKKGFIINRFRLKSFLSKIDNLIDQYKRDTSFFPSEYEKTRIKPINLVILIWSHALKKGGRVDWINMEKLIQWFLKILEEILVLDIYGVENKNIFSPERMRFINNRYKGTTCEDIGFSIFLDSFKNEEQIVERRKWNFISTNAEKIDYSDPLFFLDELLYFGKTPKAYLGLLDLGITYNLIEEYE